MAQHKKDAKFLSCKLDSGAFKKLEEISEKTRLTKTAVVEVAIEEYYKTFRKKEKA